MIILDVENIILSSINEKYNYNFKKRQLFLNSNYKTFKDLVSLTVRKVRIDPPYQVSIFFEGYIDVDAPIKAILDGLQAAGVLKNDRDVLDLRVMKKRTKRSKYGKLKIEVGHFDENQSNLPVLSNKAIGSPTSSISKHEG